MSERHPEYDRLIDEHRELMGKVAEFSQWWEQLDELGTPHFREMGNRLNELRGLLARHFADEEAGGYLGGILDVAPQFAHAVEELQPQHAQFLQSLDDLIGRLKAVEPPFESWQAAKREFDAFLGDLRTHERRENALAQSAYGQDVGTGD